MEAVIEAALVKNAPVIIQTSVTPAKFLKPEVVVAIYKVLAESLPIPVCLHLDHCRDIDFCKKCADLGYTNIMFDGSHLDFEENKNAALKEVYQAIPSHEEWPNEEETKSIPDPVKNLFIISASTFNYMETTGIYSDTSRPELEDLPNDMINFGFYTCFCFQWTLFENFIKTSLLDLNH